MKTSTPFEQAHSEHPPPAFEAWKRFTDVAIALLLLVALSPLLVFVALSICLTSRGPILFRQKRLTHGGRAFMMYKFRTMVIDAESGSGAVWASLKDNRVTSVGRLLRLTRIDELPQLVNVIIGDMSLIGPRPERPELARELQKELPEFAKRHSVKGGITGLAQVTSGYASSLSAYREKLDADLHYVRQRSIGLDFKIALKTLLVIVTGRGAR